MTRLLCMRLSAGQPGATRPNSILPNADTRTQAGMWSRGRRAREEKTSHARAVSFAGFGEALISGPGLADPPRASRPKAEAVEVEIDDGCRVEGQKLADEQPADDRNPERAAQFGTLAEADRKRHRPEHRRHCRHDDRPEAFQAALIDRLVRAQT